MTREEREEIEKQLATVDEELDSLDSVHTVHTELPSVWWTTENAMTISAIVLGFAFVVLCLLTYLLLKKPSRDGEMILRVFGTVIIIFGALFLIVAGYTDVQMAPVMGLLGTIAGYLLGKTAAKDSAKPEK